MMKITTSVVILLTTFLFQSLPANAETGYVSDQLYVTIRSGKSQQHTIVKTMKTDTPFEILDDSDKKYFKVRTRGGKTGYVLKQYVTTEKPKYMIINRLKQENERSKQQIENLKQELQAIQDELASRQEEHKNELAELSKNTKGLKNQLTASRTDLKELQKRYDNLRRQSGNLESTISERNNLRERTVALDDKVKKLQARNSGLKNMKMLKWFLAGGGVFLAGWLIGRTPRQKKIRW